MKNKLFLVLCLFATTTTFAQQLIKMTKGQNDLYQIPCTINGRTTNFIFDTGADDVTLTTTYYNSALKDGSLKTTDVYLAWNIIRWPAAIFIHRDESISGNLK